MSTDAVPPIGGTMIVPPEVIKQMLKSLRDWADSWIKKLEEIENPPPPPPPPDGVIVNDSTSKPDPYTS